MIDTTNAFSFNPVATPSARTALNTAAVVSTRRNFSGPTWMMLVAGGNGAYRERGSERSGDRIPGLPRAASTPTLGSHGRPCCPTAWSLSRVETVLSASAEMYDPASGTWTPTGSLTTARFDGELAAKRGALLRRLPQRRQRRPNRDGDKNCTDSYSHAHTHSHTYTYTYSDSDCDANTKT